MASKYLQKFPVPAGFQQILSDFTRQVLRDQPSNIIEYAAQYFQMLQKGKKFQFDSKYNVKKDDKKYELGYNAKNAQDITKKAGSITANLNKNAAEVIAPEQPKKVVEQAANKPTPTVVTPTEQPKVEQPKVEQPKVEESRKVVEEKSPVIGTEKTVTGQETTQYVDNLSSKIAENQTPGESTPPNEEVEKVMKSQPSEQAIHDSQQIKMMEAAVQTTVDILFEKYDADKNGYLASKEIDTFVRQVIKEMNEGAQVSAEDIKQITEVVDKDQDGRISKSELGKFIHKIMNL